MPHSEEVSAATEADRQHHRTVHIYIDRIEKTSPDPTTGVALYALGSIADTYVLFREVQGRRDDELIPRTDAPLRLTEWEHFYSAQAKLNPGSAV